MGSALDAGQPVLVGCLEGDSRPHLRREDDGLSRGNPDPDHLRLTAHYQKDNKVPKRKLLERKTWHRGWTVSAYILTYWPSVSSPCLPRPGR